jgi:membrane protease YdiL (CAAX protease family)
MSCDSLAPDTSPNLPRDRGPSSPWLAVITARRAGSLPRHCLWATVWSLLSLPLLLAAYGIAQALGVDTVAALGPERAATVGEFVGTVVLAPLTETLLLGGLLWGLSRLTPRPLLVAGLSALLWGALHAQFGGLRFFGSAWTFYVLGCAYLAWRPVGFGHAFVAAAVPHVVINLSVMLAVAAA